MIDTGFETEWILIGVGVTIIIVALMMICIINLCNKKITPISICVIAIFVVLLMFENIRIFRAIGAIVNLNNIETSVEFQVFFFSFNFLSDLFPEIDNTIGQFNFESDTMLSTYVQRYKDELYVYIVRNMIWSIILIAGGAISLYYTMANQGNRMKMKGRVSEREHRQRRNRNHRISD